MTTLTLRLAGPMQAWGSASRFVRRTTERHPTKSGILGLISAALGHRRTDSIEPLLGLSFGVRLDQPGELLRDFQTARTLDERISMPLTYRYYLSDAVFLAAVEGKEELLVAIRTALLNPTFPLYLGRRSCPPAGRLVLDLHESPLYDVLHSHPWVASEHHKRTIQGPIRLEIVTDEMAAPASVRESGISDTVRDIPLSFDPEYRDYGWRQTITSYTEIHPGDINGIVEHDPMSLLGG